ncbi:MAG: stage II sporulation protein D [Clostridia bacterium]|nr:stage II sporulation protein D [Clostridia bacterium]
MKGTFLIAIILIFSMLAVPLSALDKSKDTVYLPTANAQSDIPYEKNDKTSTKESIKVLKEGEVVEYSIGDYIFGVVAAEMPALYDEEALKAQAVAAYTFANYKKEQSDSKDYDISSDPDTAQCFITREEATARWGAKATEYIEKIDKCIDAVQGEILTYNNKPIFAAYHAISSGVTNSCADVWESDLPYLKPVDSVGDTLASGYLSEVKLTADEVAEKLKSIAEVSGDKNDYFTNITVNNSGYVTKLSFCGKQTTGNEIAKLLGLRSSCFEIKLDDAGFIFTVKGYGHGVGMSQTGADHMAKQGKTYKEILEHYYPEAVLQKN